MRRPSSSGIAPARQMKPPGRALRGPACSLAVLALLAGAVAAHGEPCSPAQRSLLARAQQTYQSLTSFQSAFTQEDRIPGAAPLTASGTLAYRKPGRMRWEYAPPNEQLLVTDGKTVWLYDPLLESVTEQALTDVTQGTPLRFLLGAGSLTDDFTCRAITQKPDSHDGLTYLELVPRKAIPTLEFLQLGVRADDARIEAFRMLDTQGGERWVRLTGFKAGVPLPEDRFVFKVTPGMDVIKK
ncbi:MAG: outer membrane lipoprotein chaperone LolA [SAR324 cluster bacterium]